MSEVHSVKKLELSIVVLALLIGSSYFLYATVVNIWPFNPGLAVGDPAVTERPTITWPTYSSEVFEFEFKYPPEFTVTGETGISDIDTEYLIVRIMSNDYPAEGPVFFSVRSFEPVETDPLSCDPGVNLGTIVLGGITAYKCIELIKDEFPSITVEMTRNGSLYYNLHSQAYSGDRIALIDTIMQTFRFLD